MSVKIWLTMEHPWYDTSYEVVALELTDALRKKGCDVILTRGIGDNNWPQDPGEWTQIHLGIKDFHRWDKVDRYIAYPLYSAIPFPWNERDQIVALLNTADLIFVLDVNTARIFTSEGVLAGIAVIRHGGNPEKYPYLDRSDHEGKISA